MFFLYFCFAPVSFSFDKMPASFSSSGKGAPVLQVATSEPMVQISALEITTRATATTTESVYPACCPLPQGPKPSIPCDFYCPYENADYLVGLPDPITSFDPTSVLSPLCDPYEDQREQGQQIPLSARCIPTVCLKGQPRSGTNYLEFLVTELLSLYCNSSQACELHTLGENYYLSKPHADPPIQGAFFRFLISDTNHENWAYCRKHAFIETPRSMYLVMIRDLKDMMISSCRIWDFICNPNDVDKMINGYMHYYKGQRNAFHLGERQSRPRGVLAVQYSSLSSSVRLPLVLTQLVHYFKLTDFSKAASPLSVQQFISLASGEFIKAAQKRHGPKQQDHVTIEKRTNVTWFYERIAEWEKTYPMWRREDNAKKQQTARQMFEIYQPFDTS
eukprot:gb/GEZN01008731.1/.p1 GENE.gb/GEZN01008731.1/~~gb/GEZN01008731.1/.p1  ORF type:complete len:409 (-),score=61.18 gb/GEZN01008731.1/:169-1338(-)